MVTVWVFTSPDGLRKHRVISDRPMAERDAREIAHGGGFNILGWSVSGPFTEEDTYAR